MGARRSFAPVSNLPLLVPQLARTTVQAFIRDTWRLADAWRLQLGLNADYVSDLPEFQAGKHLHPRLALAYSPADTLILSLHYGSGMRTPTLAERTDRQVETLPSFLQQARFAPNPQLPAAALHQVDARLRARHPVSRRLAFSVNGVAYYTFALDSVATIPQTGGSDSLSRRSLVEGAGARLLLGVALGERLSLRGGVWWQRLWDHGTDAQARTLLVSQPQLGGMGLVNLALPEVGELNLIGRSRSARRNNSRSSVEALRQVRLPADFVLDVAYRSVPIAQRLRLGASIHNALDTRWRDAAPLPARTPGQVPREGLQVLLTAEVLL